MEDAGTHAPLCSGYDRNRKHNNTMEDVSDLLKDTSAHIRTETPNWSNASRTKPVIEAVVDNGGSVFLDVPIHSVQVISASQRLSDMLDSAEKSKRD